MTTFGIYDLQTGVFRYCLGCSILNLADNIPDGCGAILIANQQSDATHMVDVQASPHSVISKAEMTIVGPNSVVADGQQEAIFTGFPEDTTVSVFATNYSGPVFVGQASAQFILSVDLPGTYMIRFENQRFLTKEVSIEGVVAA